jgi:predicted O-methyltransferase YrrM
MELTPQIPSARLFAVKMMRTLGINKIAHRIYYEYFHGFNTASRYAVPAIEQCLRRLAESGPDRSGDYMEFGVFKGYAFWHAQRIARELRLDSMRFFGFDSFAGLPAPRGVDATPDETFYQGQYACTKTTVEQNLNARGVDWDRTFLIEGLFADSLAAATRKAYGMDRVALALIDCDLHESTVQVLAFLEPLLDDGSILIFDDWNAFGGDDDKGQRRAWREFLAGHEGWSAEPWLAYGHYGQVFVLARRRAS